MSLLQVPQRLPVQIITTKLIRDEPILGGAVAFVFDRVHIVHKQQPALAAASGGGQALVPSTCLEVSKAPALTILRHLCWDTSRARTSCSRSVGLLGREEAELPDDIVEGDLIAQVVLTPPPKLSKPCVADCS
eukprot:scaffold7246_cov79-Phaeocystis_antarctica.AAC.3